MDQDRVMTHSRVSGKVRTWLVLLGNSYPSTPKKWIIKKNILS